MRKLIFNAQITRNAGNFLILMIHPIDPGAPNGEDLARIIKEKELQWKDLGERGNVERNT